MRPKGDIDKWKEIYHSQKNSGLTIKDWCEKNNIKLTTFKYWHKQIRKIEKQEVNWVKIIPPKKVLTEEIGAVSNTPITINIGKLSISVQKGFDKETLAELLAVLQISC